MLPLISAGLAVLPKLPEIWKSVAGLFGKSVPKSVEEAGKLASSIATSLAKKEIPPETQVELQKIMNTHEEKIAELNLERTKLDYADLSDQRDLNKVYIQSEDKYVRHTRPKILRSIFYLTAAYTLLVPISVLVLKVDSGTLTNYIGLVKSIGYYLYGMFSLSFLGYAGARSIDKRNPNLKDTNNLLGNIINKVL